MERAFELSKEARGAVDGHFARVAERDGVPGIAYGVIDTGGLVHSGGVGTTRIGEFAPPGPDSVSRICSMTKSFVATAILVLRDEGRLRLDDLVADHVPELSSLVPPTADSPPVTVRSLLTMSAGLPEDDAWGDRLMDLTAAEVDEVFRRGATFARSPGTAYEYSNFGWVMLGRVATNVSGESVQTFVNERVLRPLGLLSTTWDAPDAPAMTGYRRRDGGWLEEPPPLRDGDFAPMAGLWTTVRDLAGWVAFFLDAFPPRDDPESGPLSRASRREMQQAHRAWPSRYDAETGRLDAGGYGMGLGVDHDLRFGHVVGHAGGLPGFGSHMRWLPERGIGVVALGNVTYAPMRVATLETLELLDELGALPPKRVPAASDHLLAARDGLVRLLNGWDDALADSLFAVNVFLDEERGRRRAEAEGVRDRHGSFTAGDLEVESATRGSFACRGREREIRVSVMLTPEVPPRVEWYELSGGD